jgi:hypothetical protein
MTNTVMTLINCGAIRSIRIALIPKGTAAAGLGRKYDALIRWEWAADVIKDFDSLQELDEYLVETLKASSTRYQDYIKVALGLLEKKEDDT